MFGPDFYPTPRHVAAQMLRRVENKDARHFLEPQAGKGDLAEVLRRADDNYHRKNDVDCIEIEPDLISALIGREFPVVGNDFLTYQGICYYDAIVMNPPFSTGDQHLLKAWDFMYNGEVVSLLNVETLNNRCTETRQRLGRLVDQQGSVEVLGDVFSTAQRKTNVNVAMVHLKKTAEDEMPDLWAHLTEEKTPDDNIGKDPEALAVRDLLGNMQHYYDMANTHMMRAFQEIRRAQVYMAANQISGLPYRDGKREDLDQILSMAATNPAGARAAFAKLHRRCAWMRVFEKMEFRKFLDKKQTEQFLRDIEINCNVQFTKENIKETAFNVFRQRRKLFEMSVANVFDELTKFYAGNTTGAGGGGSYSGWKTNDSYKVNEKLVFPYGCQYDKDMANFRLWRSQSNIDIYNDLDRVLCVLDGKPFEHCITIAKALDYAFSELDKKKLPWGTRGSRANWTQAEQVAGSEYFNIRFFMKGTVHLTWKRQDLREQFNVTAAAGKKWIGQNTQQEN